MLKIQRLHAETCSKHRWYFQMQKCSYVCVLKGRNIHTAAEMFIHVAIQNFTTWLSYIVLGITAGQQTITIDSVVCPITLEWIIWRYPVKWLEIHCFSNIVHTTIMAYHGYCILVQWKQDILVSFTNSVLWRSVWSGCIYLNWSPWTSALWAFSFHFMPVSLFDGICRFLKTFFEKNTCQPCNVISA